METRQKLNKSGQVLGRKGADTRVRALEALEKLLADSRGVEPTAAAVARAAGISAPAFYLYFGDIGEAVLALVGQLGERFRPVVDLLDEDWPEDALFDRAKGFVEAYFAYWSANASLLRARNRLADQGDQRFIELRMYSADELSRVLSAKMRPVPGGFASSPRSMATVLITALERLATVSVLNLYPGPDDRVELVASLANMVAMTMRGRG
jgi:AcrR family transcriptional regulator